jgi:hypothetical protein
MLILHQLLCVLFTLRGITTRKKLARSAPNMATRSAYAVRCG